MEKTDGWKKKIADLNIVEDESFEPILYVDKKRQWLKILFIWMVDVIYSGAVVCIMAVSAQTRYS